MRARKTPEIPEPQATPAKTKRVSKKQAQPVEIDQLLTMTQAAGRLGIGRTKLYDLINNNELPYVEIPGKGDNMKRISVLTLNAWIKNRETVKHAS